MAMYLGKQRVAILSQKYTAEKFTIRKTLNFGSLSQSTLFRVKKVKGATVKSKNLIPYPFYETTKTQNGITFTDNGDGSISVNGTATAGTLFRLKNGGDFPVGTFTLSGGKENVIITARKNNTSWIDSKTETPTRTGEFNDGDVFDYIGLYILNGKTVNNVTVYPMLNEGETALPYQPYFTGLKHAYINSIKSTGKNLFNAETATHGKALSVENGELYNNATRFSSDYIAVLSETQYYINWETVRWACCYDANKNFIGQTPYKNNIFTTLERTAYMRITANLDELNTIMLNQGETAFPFESYKEDTWQLSETLELGEWDELNPQTGEVKRAATERIVFDGTEDWTVVVEGAIYGEGDYYRFIANNKKLPISENGICNLYPIHCLRNYNFYYGILVNDNGIVCGSRLAKEFNNRVEAWKAHLAELSAAGNPLTIVYEKEGHTIEKIEGCPLAYNVFQGGTERVIQGEVDNSQFEAIPTIETGHTVIMELIIGDENG